MNHQARTYYLSIIVSKYISASKEEKTRILDDAVYFTKLERKHIIRRLNRGPHKIGRKKGSGRGFIYSKLDLIPHIKLLWHQMERISAPRMKEGLRDFLRFYDDCSVHLKLQLLTMSASTLNRYLKDIRHNEKVKKGLSTTCPARYMKNKVPINTLDSKIKKPGYTQTDTVAHCGNSAKGPFISSLTVTDIFTAWTVNRAMYTKKGTYIRKYFTEIEAGLPFKLLAINSDSGSEFLNKNMLKFTKHGTRIEFTRSRPYKKNDNCYVEQKNFTHVRELFGYKRFDDEHLVPLMNEIYIIWNDFQNYFIPTFKLKEKIRIGSRIKKTYGKPKTSYQRVIESNVLSKRDKEALINKKLQLNPELIHK